ncbi:MAG TPA: dihydroorotase [Verrucomicrobia bacterium]|nr:dihydroorotase [Verrucomicrobiales bacterium]HIL53506.1 dihydroorotase [Verrucomicrobiota bacterium]
MDDLILLKQASVASEDSTDLFENDVLVENGVIKAVSSSLNASDGTRVIDAKGKVLLPGLFDVHVHVREPGQTSKETIRTGSEAAINGGVTGIVAMPNTVPAIDNGGMVRSVLEIAGRDSRVEFFTTGCITKDRKGKEMAAIGGMKEAGVVMITDDGSPVENPQLLRRAMEYAREFDLPLASHCETMHLSGAGAMNEGKRSYKLGVPGIPSISEEVCIARDIQIAAYTGAHLHLQHVTTARGMELIRRAKNDGVKITCEVAPHHLIFNENDIVNYDTYFKMNPPLRTEEDNEKLLEGLIEGVFDVIATDHAPHTEFEKKQQDFETAPFGITGLETALPSLYHHYIKEGKFGWDLLVKRYAAEPRRILNLDQVSVKEGSRAELVLFDPQATTTFSQEFMKSKSPNTPFLDKELQGSVDLVVNGEEVLLDRSDGAA